MTKRVYSIQVDEGSFFDRWDLYNSVTKKSWSMDNPNLVPEAEIHAWAIELKSIGKATPVEIACLLRYVISNSKPPYRTKK